MRLVCGTLIGALHISSLGARSQNNLAIALVTGSRVLARARAAFCCVHFTSEPTKRQAN